jgi:hypothetical protein
MKVQSIDRQIRHRLTALRHVGRGREILYGVKFKNCSPPVGHNRPFARSGARHSRSILLALLLVVPSVRMVKLEHPLHSSYFPYARHILVFLLFASCPLRALTSCSRTRGNPLKTDIPLTEGKSNGFRVTACRDKSH